MTASPAVSALIVSNPSDGGQSTSTVSYFLVDPRAVRSRYSRASSGTSSTSAPAISGPEGTMSRPGTAVGTIDSSIGRSFRMRPYTGFGGALLNPKQLVAIV